MRCPWCKKAVPLGRQITTASEEGPVDHCPHCGLRIVYAQEIYPSKRKSWDKP
jgi:DNA-directed RNA polymerase subunit RPC12/RpoP